MTELISRILSESLLERCRSRAPAYDQRNAFCQEDFDELVEAGYLRMAVPTELGGFGLRLSEVADATSLLARYAPATALCLNMHTYWVGLAADLWRSGDTSLEFILHDALAGEVYAAGHGEPGNETSLFMSLTKAEKVDGGYAFTGRKTFGSLSPVWTRFGLHGMDVSDPASPKIVHAFLPRDATGYQIRQTWDVMGMRATRSDDTILEGAVVPDDLVVRVLPAGFKGADAFVLGIFAWALIGFASVYRGVAERAIELMKEQVSQRRSMALTRSMAWHPEVQHTVADMVMEWESIDALIDRTASDWANGVQHADWPVKIVTAKYRAVEGAWSIVDKAMEVSGGAGMFRHGELERLFRDARAGRFHPANSAASHEVVGKLALGLDPDEAPRWG